MYGLMDLKSELSADGQILSVFTSPVSANRAELWWSLILVGAALLWLARRQFSERRAVRLLFLTLILVLLGQTDFISNRFSPFFGFAGVGFLAFGIVWDALTIGPGERRHAGLPRISRIFLYLGYILLTIVVIHWAVTTHDLAMLGQLTGDLGLVGLGRFGRPMLVRDDRGDARAAVAGGGDGRRAWRRRPGRGSGRGGAGRRAGHDRHSVGDDTDTDPAASGTPTRRHSIQAEGRDAKQ